MMVLTKVIDLVGHRFGKLTVIKINRVSVKYGAYWECLCDCGKKRVVKASLLKSGDIHSCGSDCNAKLATEFTFEDKTDPNSALMVLYNRYKKGAEERNLSFDLSIKSVKYLTKLDCFYCGIEPRQKIYGYRNEEYIYNGIDRVESYKGYTISNVVPCCKMCNMAKLNYSQEDFFMWVDRIYNHLHSNKFLGGKDELPNSI
jgi:hypothetical protein